MDESIYKFVDLANANLKEFKKEICVLSDVDNPTLFSVDILTINERGEIDYILTYAENYREEELLDVLTEAWADVQRSEDEKVLNQDFIRYRKVPGWTHDLPALIFNFTEVPLFFYDKRKGTVEVVRNSVDKYDKRDGYFCVSPEDYTIALRQIEDHDERGVEH